MIANRPGPNPVGPNSVCPVCGGAVQPTDRFCETCGGETGPGRTGFAWRYPEIPEPPSRQFGTKSKVALAAVAVIAAISAVLLLAGQERSELVSATGDASALHDLSGRIIVEHPDIESGLTGCLLPAPNQNLGPGAVIVVLDNTQRVIAIGAVQTGTVVADDLCHLTYRIPDLPKTAEYYLVIGDVTLPEISYSLLDRTGWRLDIQLSDVQE